MFRETIIKFDNPAKDWEHATPIGNGKLGAMVFGNVRKERILYGQVENLTELITMDLRSIKKY